MFLISIVPFNAIAQIDNEDIYIHKSNGLSMIDQKDYKGAILEFTKYIKKSEPVKYKYAYLETLHLRAHCKSMLEDFRGSIMDYELIISKCKELDYMKNDVYSSAFYYMGICKYYLRRVDEACLVFSKAGELGYSKSYDLIKEYCN